MNRYHTRKQSFPLFFMGIMLLILAGCGDAIYGSPASETNIAQETIADSPAAAPDSIPEIPDHHEQKEHLPLKESGFDSITPTASLPAAIPGQRTLENLLRTALLPVGSTMYIWGGGWNEEDTGAGPEAVTIGLSPSWKEYADLQSYDYDYRQTKYLIHQGLDCSGYVGWVIYNVMETQNDQPGYVLSSTKMASTYASYGWGDYLPSKQVTDYLPGDIMSRKGHVWISLGTCPDGSVLLLHSSPPGVRICGTVQNGMPSQASLLAETIMKEHFPHWYERFPSCTVSSDYLSQSSQMRWKEDFFPDAGQIQGMKPEDLMKYLLSDPSTGNASSDFREQSPNS